MSPRRRAPVESPRQIKLVVRLSVLELTDVARVAEQQGLAVGAWVGDLAVQAARTGDVDVRRRLLRMVLAARAGCVDAVLLGRLDDLADVLVERLS